MQKVRAKVIVAGNQFGILGLSGDARIHEIVLPALFQHEWDHLRTGLAVGG